MNYYRCEEYSIKSKAHFDQRIKSIDNQHATTFSLMKKSENIRQAIQQVRQKQLRIKSNSREKNQASQQDCFSEDNCKMNNRQIEKQSTYSDALSRDDRTETPMFFRQQAPSEISQTTSVKERT